MTQSTEFSPRRVAVIGSSGGIGGALCRRLLQQQGLEVLYSFSRSQPAPESHPAVRHHYIDISSEDSIAEAASFVESPLDLVICATGFLHGDGIMPERALKELRVEKFKHNFLINTIAPALMAKHFLPLLPRDNHAVFAALSARVGSISDNALGGWYSYRASKAALNMVLRCAAIELARTHTQAAVVGLHPGTVDTQLSQPFQSAVKKDHLFAPDYAAERLLEVVMRLTPQDSGGCFAWDGARIPA